MLVESYVYVPDRGVCKLSRTNSHAHVFGVPSVGLPEQEVDACALKTLGLQPLEVVRRPCVLTHTTAFPAAPTATTRPFPTVVADIPALSHNPHDSTISCHTERRVAGVVTAPATSTTSNENEHNRTRQTRPHTLGHLGTASCHSLECTAGHLQNYSRTIMRYQDLRRPSEPEPRPPKPFP